MESMVIECKYFLENILRNAAEKARYRGLV